jgi:hypothetical protein
VSGPLRRLASYEEESINIVSGVFNKIISSLSSAGRNFEVFTQNVNLYAKGNSCRDFAEVYEANSGFFRRGVIEINDIIQHGNDYYSALYNSNFCSSVREGRELAHYFQSCLMDAIGRLYNMATYLQQVFDITVSCCLKGTQTVSREGPLKWPSATGSSQGSIIDVISIGSSVQNLWPDVIRVFPLTDNTLYTDPCVYISKYATVNNIAILFNGFGKYFSMVYNFVSSLFNEIELYRKFAASCEDIFNPLRKCSIKDMVVSVGGG